MWSTPWLQDFCLQYAPLDHPVSFPKATYTRLFICCCLLWFAAIINHDPRRCSRTREQASRIAGAQTRRLDTLFGLMHSALGEGGDSSPSLPQLFASVPHCNHIQSPSNRPPSPQADSVYIPSAATLTAPPLVSHKTQHTQNPASHSDPLHTFSFPGPSALSSRRLQAQRPKVSRSEAIWATSRPTTSTWRAAA